MAALVCLRQRIRTQSVVVMELSYVYTKKRAEFGHECAFTDVPARILESIPSRWGRMLAH